MGKFLIHTGEAKRIQETTDTEVSQLAGLRKNLRNGVETARAILDDGPIPAALDDFWNSQCAVQCQAAETKGANATLALKSVIASYLAFDDDATELATRAADNVPKNVTTVTDQLP